MRPPLPKTIWSKKGSSSPSPITILHLGACQVRVYSGRGSGQVWTKSDEGREQRVGQEISPAGVGDRLDSTTKDNER